MSPHLQYGIALLVVAAAAWSAWRKLTGRHVFRRGRKADGCAACDAAGEHRH